MFKGFDFGKGLTKQVDSYLRGTPQQQKRKEAGLLRALEKYTTRYMAVVEKPGGANPGQLKNGAEVLVEAAHALHESSIVFKAFAELVLRSRKVPVVPGLAGLVDHLLEVPTHLKEERVALLSWRITTGSMRPDRLLHYLSERAQLTGDSSHWKDYVWGLTQQIKKDEIKLDDELATNALEELLKNTGKLGDQVINVQLMATQGLIERGQGQAAENLLIEVKADPDDPPEGYLETIQRLLEIYGQAEWGLHAIALKDLMGDYHAGLVSWGGLRERLNRSQDHREGLIEFLLDLPELAGDVKLSEYTVKQILRLGDPQRIGHLVERWAQCHTRAHTSLPDGAIDLLRQAANSGRLPKSFDSNLLLSNGIRFDAADRGVHERYIVEPPHPQLSTSVAPGTSPGEAETGSVTETLEPVMLDAPELIIMDMAPVEPADDDAESLKLEDTIAAGGVEDAEPAEPAGLGADDDEVADRQEQAAADDELDVGLEENADIAESAEVTEPVDIEVEPDEAVAAADSAEDDIEAEIAELLHAGESDDPAVSDTEFAAETVEPESAASDEDFDAGPDLLSPDPADTDLLESDGDRPLIACTSSQQLTNQLEQRFANRLTTESADCLIDELAEADAEKWLIDAARRWVAEQLLMLGETVPALQHLDGVLIKDEAMAAEFIQLVHDAVGEDELPPEGWALLGKLALARNDYNAVFEYASVLPEDYPARFNILTALETWVVSQFDPPPAMLMVLARSRQLLSSDNEAGFEPATTASLLDAGSARIQEAYQAWVSVLDPEVVHRQRAQLATYLCINEQRHDLLPTAVTEIAALVGCTDEAPTGEALQLLTTLRPALELVPATEQADVKVQWTRLYLQLAAQSGQDEQEQALRTAQEVEPRLAISLASELGLPVPASARLVVECEDLARQGEWQQAVALLNDVEAGDPTGVVPIKLLCDYLPAEALPPAMGELQRTLAERGDTAGLFELVLSVDARLAADGDMQHSLELRNLADELLLQLSRDKHEPALKYMFTSNRSIGDPVEALRGLLILVQNGDGESLDRLRETLLSLLPDGEPADLLSQAADELARAGLGEDPEQALELLARTGLATGQPQWARDRIADLGLPAESIRARQLLGQLALGCQDFALAQEQLQALAAQSAYAAAQELSLKIVELQPQSRSARRELIELLLNGETRDLALATKHVLKLAQVCHEADTNLQEVLGDLADRIETVLADTDADLEADILRLAVTALSSDHQHASELVEQMIARNPEALDRLLGLFESMALEDAEMPANLVVTWGRVLFKAGRVADALDHLAGLREAVGDYPEYTTLLKEIRDSGGGPGASMQLGEAYLRVNLWQRSAEEYASALNQDENLAIPILIQLRHQGALDPNPMQYPLHLLGLRCVTYSDRASDWGWALSALTWLLPRWSAEELYGLAQTLLQHINQVELEDSQQLDLLMHLFKLANKLGLVEEAFGYLSRSWDLVDQPDDELLDALAEFDRSKLPEVSPLLAKLFRMELEVAIQRDAVEPALIAAQSLAAMSDEGRETALRLLAEYQREVTDPVPVLLARLQLIRINTDEGRQQFVEELLAAAETDLPSREVHSLIRTVVGLIEETTSSPQLTKLLLQLFQQLGDQARAWELALSFIHGEGELTDLAMDVLTQLVQDDFAISLRVSLIEVYLLRGEPDVALKHLLECDVDGLDDQGAAAARLAETLLATPGVEQARRWLVSYYLAAKKPELAADHLVWAWQAGQRLPAEWLFEQTSGELLFRAAQLKEINAEVPAARQLLERAADRNVADRFINAAIRLRLSQLSQAAGDLVAAGRHNRAVLEVMPGHLLALEREELLERDIRLERISQLRETPDSPERTIELAKLLCLVGDELTAINELQAAIGRGQMEPEIYIELAECFNLTKDFAIARRAFDELLRRLDTMGDHTELRLRALYGLATAEERLGETASAVRCLERILVLKHSYRDSRQRLEGLTSARRGGPAPGSPGGARQEILSEILSMLGRPKDEEQDGRSE